MKKPESHLASPSHCEKRQRLEGCFSSKVSTQDWEAGMVGCCQPLSLLCQPCSSPAPSLPHSAAAKLEGQMTAAGAVTTPGKGASCPSKTVLKSHLVSAGKGQAGFATGRDKLRIPSDRVTASCTCFAFSAPQQQLLTALSPSAAFMVFFFCFLVVFPHNTLLGSWTHGQG